MTLSYFHRSREPRTAARLTVPSSLSRGIRSVHLRVFRGASIHLDALVPAKWFRGQDVCPLDPPSPGRDESTYLFWGREPKNTRTQWVSLFFSAPKRESARNFSVCCGHDKSVADLDGIWSDQRQVDQSGLCCMTDYRSPPLNYTNRTSIDLCPLFLQTPPSSLHLHQFHHK